MVLRSTKLGQVTLCLSSSAGCAHCPAKARVVEFGDASGCGKVMLGLKHNHDMDNLQKDQLPRKIELLLWYWVHHPTPTLNKNDIWQHLAANNIDTKIAFQYSKERAAQVRRWITAQKLKAEILATTYGEHEAFCLANVLKPLTIELLDDHQPFVCRQRTVDPEAAELSITVTTKHLLQNIRRGGADLRTLHQDGTGRLMVNGSMLYVFSTKDVNNNYHYVAMTIVRRESHDVIKTALEGLADALAHIFDVDFTRELTRVVSDNNTNIVTANAEVFPNLIHHAICYWHLLQKILEQKKKFSSGEVCDKFILDVIKCANGTIYHFYKVALEKLLDKYKDEKVAMTWFKKYWCGDRATWFYQAVLCSRANSGAEGMNNDYKNSCTKRQYIAPNEFFPLLLNWMQTTSIMDTKFATTIELTKKDWHDAQNLLCDDLEGYFDKIAVTKNLRSQVVLRIYFLSVGAYRGLSDNGKKEIPDEDVKKILEPYKDLVIHGVDDEAHKEATFDELC